MAGRLERRPQFREVVVDQLDVTISNPLAAGVPG